MGPLPTVGSSGARRVDPGHRLAVYLAAAHRPVKQVFESARECTGVFRRADQDGGSGPDTATKVSDNRMEWLLIMVWVEGW